VASAAALAATLVGGDHGGVTWRRRKASRQRRQRSRKAAQTGGRFTSAPLALPRAGALETAAGIEQANIANISLA